MPPQQSHCQGTMNTSGRPNHLPVALLPPPPRPAYPPNFAAPTQDYGAAPPSKGGTWGATPRGRGISAGKRVGRGGHQMTLPQGPCSVRGACTFQGTLPPRGFFAGRVVCCNSLTDKQRRHAAVVNTNRGGHLLSNSTSPTMAAPTSLSVVNGKPLQVHQRARPCRCTGRHNCLVRPILPTRLLPPTHPQHWWGFLRQLRPSWRKQPLLIALRCCPLHPTQRHLILPPSSHPTLLGSQSLRQEGMPIHSRRVDLLLHRRSARDASSVLIVFANVMAFVLPIKRGLFFASNVIGLALPTNLLGMDGLKQGGEGI
jgi:hypothetical protein